MSRLIGKCNIDSLSKCLGCVGNSNNTVHIIYQLRLNIRLHFCGLVMKIDMWRWRLRYTRVDTTEQPAEINSPRGRQESDLLWDRKARALETKV